MCKNVQGVMNLVHMREYNYQVYMGGLRTGYIWEY